MSTIIRGSGDTTFGGTIQSTGIDDNATSTAITIDASENVGIGTTSPSSKLTVTDFGQDDALYVGGGLKMDDGPGNPWYLGKGILGSTGSEFLIGSGSTEVMRIDASGNVLVGKTATDLDVAGSALFNTGHAYHTRSGDTALYLNRLSSDGTIADFRKDGTTVGSIGTNGSRAYFNFNNAANLGLSSGTYSGSKGLYSCDSTGTFTDAIIDLGRGLNRFDDIYATNGTIQTSDRNEKQDIEALSDAEQRVAVAAKGLLRKFRWIDSVEEKGDDARIHFGIIAQDLQDAFAAEGLDAGRYAMFISSTWYEKLVPVDAVIGVEAVEATYDDEGAELTPAVEAVEAKDAYTRTDTEEEPTEGYTERTRLGVRYPELLAFIISAI